MRSNCLLTLFDMSSRGERGCDRSGGEASMRPNTHEAARTCANHLLLQHSKRLCHRGALPGRRVLWALVVAAGAIITQVKSSHS